METEWISVLDAAGLPDATLTQVEVEGTDGVLLFRAGGEIFGVGARCTHAGMPLRKGQTTGAGGDVLVTCPAHGSRFRLADGRVVRPPAQRPLASYDVREVEGRIELRPR